MSGQMVDDQLNELEAFEQEQGQSQANTPEPDDLPVKYRGKSAAEIARIALAQEQFIGKQAQEVGEIRRLADQLILEKLNQPKPRQAEESQPASDELTDVDFFANPVEAVKRAVDNHPAVLQGREASAKLAQQESLNRLSSTHPDYKELVVDPEFKEWVGKSRVRQQLFVQAHRNFDVDVAEELFSTFKEVRAKRTEVVNEGAEQLRQNTERALRTVSVTPGGTGQSSKKILRRTDLIDLQIRDPDRYLQMQDEIMSAYREGRVR